MNGVNYLEKLIEAKNLTKNFEKIKAVNNINIDLNQGEVLGFLGPNGAGKSTTMKMLTGFLTPTSGNIMLNGVDMANKPNLAKLELGYLPEGAPAYGEMTPYSYLKFIAEIRKLGKNKVSKVHDTLERINLSEVANQPIETLSKGYKRRVGLAQAIIHDPEILILDEPTDGLDPNQKNDVRKLIRKLGKEKAVIISTHILEEVNSICNRAMIIANGKILIDDKPINILKKSDTHNSVYLSVEEKSATELKNEIVEKRISNEVMVKNNFCMVKINNSRTTKKNIDDFLKKNNFTLKHYSIGSGSLEEVFRRLTGNE